MYNNYEEAIHFIFLAFDGKRRIKENIPMVFHSISIGFMLMENGCNEKTVLAGLLHDVIEDTIYTYDDIKTKFGKDIADMVLKVSEDKNISDWKERKTVFIKNMYEQSEDIVMVELADKLQNLLSDYSGFIKDGKEALKTLSTSYESNKWYYEEMHKMFKNKLKANHLLTRYEEMVKLYFS